MQSYLIGLRSFALIAALFSCLFFVGCSEKPERAAQKEAAKAISDALATYQRTGDFEEAHKQLSQISPEARDQDVTRFLESDYAYSTAGRLRSDLPKAVAAVENQIAQLNKTLIKLQNLQTEASELQLAITSNQQNLAALNSQLKGQDNQPGLTQQAQQLTDELARLTQQKSQLETKAQDTQRQAAALQKESDQLLRQSQSAQNPQQKEQLQKQAYAVLQGSPQSPSHAKLLAEAQGFADQAASVQSRINEVQPKLEYLNKQIQNVSTRISELQQSTVPSQSQTRIGQLETEIAQLTEQVQSQLSQIDQAKADYEKAFAQVSDNYADALKGFSRSTDSDTLNQLTKIAAGDTSLKSGLSAADYGLSLKHLGARLAILPQLEGVTNNANAKAQTWATEGNEHVAKAIEDYNNAANIYDRIRGSDEPMRKALKSNQLLALNQMAHLAQVNENQAVANDALARAKELLDEAIESDRTFILTPSAQFYYKMTGTVPPPVELPKADANEPNETAPASSEDANAPAESAVDANISDSNEPNAAPTDEPAL